MKLIIQPNYEKVCIWAAQHIAHRINSYAEDKPFIMGLPTGASPLGIYNELLKMYRDGSLSFKNVRTFNMDEYVGLGDDHPQSYHYFMKENFFKHIDIKGENTHILDGITCDPERECKLYEEAIAKEGGIELFLGGMGSNGHIAFNEPGSPLTSRTRQVTLAADTIKANARFFDNDLSKVPVTALTVGVGTIMDAREVLIIVSGQGKAHALRCAVEDAPDLMCTISCLQKHPNAVIVCDEDAAKELKPETVNYYKETSENFNF